jgi:hypothetical protein
MRVRIERNELLIQLNLQSCMFYYPTELLTACDPQRINCQKKKLWTFSR